MKMKKFLAVVLTVAMVAAMSVTAFAADLPATGEQSVSTAGSQTTIPVQISADATQLDVDVPTSFPVATDPEGNTETGENADITNNSYGAIVVSNITVKDNADGDADWHLAAFDTDMSKEKVDANKIGLSVTPKGGHAGAGVTGTALKTTDSNPAEQTLLDAANDEWVIDGVASVDTNKLTVTYEANVSAVSQQITNKTVANIIITVSWNTAA